MDTNELHCNKKTAQHNGNYEGAKCEPKCTIKTRTIKREGNIRNMKFKKDRKLTRNIPKKKKCLYV